MSNGRKLLLQTLTGHLALLGSTHPKKAKSPIAKKTQRYIKQCLRDDASSRRQAA